MKVAHLNWDVGEDLLDATPAINDSCLQGVTLTLELTSCRRVSFGCFACHYLPVKINLAVSVAEYGNAESAFVKYSIGNDNNWVRRVMIDVCDMCLIKLNPYPGPAPAARVS